MGYAQIAVDRTYTNKYVSVSRLKKYEKCALNFKLDHIDKAPERGDKTAANWGKLAHRALQLIAWWVLDHDHVGEVDDAVVIECYKRAFSEVKDDDAQQEGCEVVGLAAYKLGLKTVRDYLRLHRQWNHRRIIAVEKEFMIEIGDFNPPLLVKGYIDRIDRIDSRTALILDYKTNRFLYTREEMDDDLQMDVYGIAVRCMYPWIEEIRFGYEMLRHNKRQHTKRTEAQLREAEDYIVSLTERIESSYEFPARLNPLCPWCGHRERCGEYNEAVERGEQTLSYLVSAGDLTKVCRERARAEALEKVAKKRKEEMNTIILAHLDQQQDEAPLIVDGVRYTGRQSSDRILPLRKTVATLHKAIGMPADEIENRIATVQVKLIDALIEEAKLDSGKKRLLKADLDALVDVHPKAPFVATQKVKKATKKERR